MTSFFSRFLRNKDGNYAVITAICAVPVFAIAGLAIDYSRAIYAESKMQAAADAAVLAAVNEAKAQIAAGKSKSAAFADAKALGEDMFEANTLNYTEHSSSDVFTITMSDSGGGISAVGNWTGTIVNSLSQIAGIETLPVAIQSTAQIGGQSYVEIHFLVDTSASMGVGATSADHSIMDSALGCAFACHSPTGQTGFTSTVTAARSAGAKLRIDVVREAIDSIVDDFEAKGITGAQLSLALHTFSNTRKTLVSPTTNTNLFRDGLDGLDLDNSDMEGGTNFPVALSSLQSDMDVSGGGSGPSDRQIFVVLVTDGVATNARNRANIAESFDADPAFVAFMPQYNGSGMFAMQGFDPDDCYGIKANRKATMMTLNVRYITPTVGTDNDSRFQEIENYLVDDIQGHMQQCASAPNYALWADSADEIHAAMEKIAELISTGALRLTQ
jgi:Flp pilus assembly protein TadG